MRGVPTADRGEHFARLWRVLAPGLPAPLRELRFHPLRKWRFDAAWTEQLLAVEIEGLRQNGKSRHQMLTGYMQDAEKYNAAVELGWRVLRYTSGDLDQRPVQVIEQVRRVLEQSGNQERSQA